MIEIGAEFVMFGGLAVALVVVAWILLRVWSFLASKTKNKLDDYIVSALSRPVYVFAILLAGYLILEPVYSSVRLLGIDVRTWFFVLFVLNVAMAVNRLIIAVIRWYIDDFARRTKSRVEVTVLTTAGRVSWLVVYSVALMIILNTLGIEIGPLLAGMGVAGLAVALALQDTLSNLFAGAYIIADRQIRVGDYVKIESEGVEGFVSEIGWRNVRIRTLANNIVIFPNIKLANSVVKNYGLPDERSNILVRVGVTYETNPKKARRAIEKVVAKVKRECKDIIDKNYEPIISLSDLSDSAVVFTIIFRIIGYHNRFRLMQSIRENILEIFKKERIDIAYNTMRVFLEE